MDPGAAWEQRIIAGSSTVKSGGSPASAAERISSGSPASFAAISGSFTASRAAVQRWWKERISADDLPVLDNGSGLSRSERSTAQALTALLQAAHAGPHAQAFTDSLAVAGVDYSTPAYSVASRYASIR